MQDRTSGGREAERRQAYAYWLDNIPGIGRVKAGELLRLAGDPEALFHMPESAVEPLLSATQKAHFLNRKQHWEVEAEYTKLKKLGIRFYASSHPCYPSKLREIPDAPFGIYLKGELPEEGVCTVALIGARLCSEYGRYMARKFGYELAKAGIQVISGLASGVDGIAQKGALEAGGKVFGVLGCGVDICYPEENTAVYNRILGQGGILSEYTPGTPPRANLFPPRNRIISALSDAVLVIEAKQRSGTLITVDMALEQGKDVYALPGRVTDSLSAGCNRLIREGAGIVLSPDMLLEELSVLQAVQTGDRRRETADDRSSSGEEQAILRCLDYYPQSIEAIYGKMSETGEESRISAQLLSGLLLRLQLQGIVGQKGSSYYLCGKV